MALVRNNGIDSESRARQETGEWYYDMEELGFNYRLQDILCALGISQLRRLPGWIARRQALARRYDTGLEGKENMMPLERRGGVSHGYHLYTVRTKPGERDALFRRLRTAGIGANVHYRPIAAHSYYRRSFPPASTPVAEGLSKLLLTLPLHPGLSDRDVDFVLGTLNAAE